MMLTSISILTIAVAANFSPTLTLLVKKFEEKNPTIHVKVVSSSSGSIYRQIIQGAPYNLFLSADQSFIEKLIAQSFVSKENSFSYAEGILVICSRREKLSQLSLEQMMSRLKMADHIALADPHFAPYGIATKQFLNPIALSKDMEQKLVFTKDVGQVMNYLHTGAVSFGFVPLSIAKSGTKWACAQDNIWIIPKENYTPIVQDAALLKPSENNPSAKLFFQFLKSNEAKKIIKSSNYNLPQMKR